jgi:hypothetical protein
MKVPNVKFYCITLDSRSDRRNYMLTEFNRLNIEPIWWIIKKHPQGGKYGCFESHVNIWENNDADIAVIFEDDIKFDGHAEEFSEILQEAIILAQQYDTVHFGHIIASLDKQVSLNFYKGKFITTSCYLSTKSKLRQLAVRSKSFYGSHIDTVLIHLSSQIGLLPYRFEQDFTDSNNLWTNNIPVISLCQVDPILRKMLADNPYCLLQYPAVLPEGAIKFMLIFNTLQHILPRVLYNSGIEFMDRRV